VPKLKNNPINSLFHISLMSETENERKIIRWLIITEKYIPVCTLQLRATIKK
jgi:hypothetical protein